MEKIDTYCHVVPEGWRKWREQLGWHKPHGMPCIPAWSPEAHIELMDKLGIKRSILSITSPGTHLKLGDFEFAKQITHETNKEVAAICSKYPERFGWFASLPLPDMEGSLVEIDHALKLGASGFAVMTNAQGYYMGDSKFDPVFQKLNNHKAVVFMHPTQCCFLDSPEADKPLAQYPTPMLEYFFDTTRAVLNLLSSGTSLGLRTSQSLYLTAVQPCHHLSSALPFSRLACSALAKSSPMSKLKSSSKLASTLILRGSDYPYTPGAIVESLSSTMEVHLKGMFNEAEIKRILLGNAADLQL